jgi:hypothetical protein
MLEPIGGSRSLQEHGKEEQGLVPTEWGHAQSHQTRIREFELPQKLIAHREGISAPRWQRRTFGGGTKSWRCAFVANSAPDRRFDIPKSLIGRSPPCKLVTYSNGKFSAY